MSFGQRDHFGATGFDGDHLRAVVPVAEQAGIGFRNESHVRIVAGRAARGKFRRVNVAFRPHDRTLCDVPST